MLRRKGNRSRAVWLAAVLVGLTSNAALATDEVVVYGDDVARRARAAEAEFQALMSENAESLDRAIKASIERQVEALKMPKLQLALAEVPNRG
jgi:hypothetical protein